MFWAKTICWPKQIVCTKMRVFLPSWDKWCQASFAKKVFFIFYFLDDRLKNTIFIGLCLPFPSSFVSFFLLLFLQHKKEKQKCKSLFENLIFDIPKILQKHYFGTMWHYLCFQKYPQNTIKMGKQWKNLDQFLTLDLDQFLTLETPNRGPVFNSTAYIYIHI